MRHYFTVTEDKLTFLIIPSTAQSSHRADSTKTGESMNVDSGQFILSVAHGIAVPLAAIWPPTVILVV